MRLYSATRWAKLPEYGGTEQTKSVSNPSTTTPHVKGAATMTWAKPVSGGSQASGRLRLALTTAGVLLVLALAAMAWRSSSQDVAAQSARASSHASKPLVRRDFVRRVRLTGLSEAIRFHVATAPLLAGQGQSAGGGGGSGNLVIVKIAAPGARVKVGDVLVEFDRQSQEKIALDKKAEYEDLVNQILQKDAEQAAARVKDDSEIAQAENAVKSFELEVLKNEMLSRVKAEINDQDLAEARIKLKALRENYSFKRAAAAAEHRILEIRRDRAKAAMDHAIDNARALTVLSPIDGLVVPKMTWKGNGPADIQEGDEMSPGEPILQVVNQSSMQVRARINQADLPSVRVGLPVTVRLDAYPDLEMTGRITQIAPIGVSGSFSPRVRAFAAVIAVDGTNPRLLPDLTAAIDVEVELIKNALVVRRDAVQIDANGAHVRVRDGSGVSTRQVALGPSDEVDVVVTSGLEAGQVIVQ
jgi:HlyD family secretion protein